MDDRRIIDLFFARDEAAIKETQTKYGKLCFKIARNILNNSEDAEECVNDTYLSLWNAIPPERPHSLLAFVIRIARNLSFKRLEYNTAEKRNPNCVISWSELEECIPDQSFKAELDESELGDLINSFLHGQKEDVRNVFVRRYYFGDDILDIAERYRFSESKVKSMLFATRNKLKTYLKENGVLL